MKQLDVEEIHQIFGYLFAHSGRGLCISTRLDHRHLQCSRDNNQRLLQRDHHKQREQDS